MKFQVPRGTKDILPQDVYLWQEVERRARSVFSRYNFSEIRTPIFEDINLFQRTLGQTTEIVQKQMFAFTQGDDTLVLRPEATASIARAYLEHSMGFGSKIQKLFYVGPMFRAERPQKGRLRQFHHIGVEAIGSFNPYVDSEILEMANQLLIEYGISGHSFLINSLGCKDDKVKFAASLRKGLVSRKEELCEDCRERIERNVFRVLDCKKEQCRAVVRELNVSHAHLCAECKKNFDLIVERAKSCGIPFAVNSTLVRGLDYYSGMVFEVTHPALGAQDALGAGGRYDYLFEELSGERIGAVGFAFGVERLLLTMPPFENVQQLASYVIPIGEASAAAASEIAKEIRQAGMRCDVDYSQGSLKSMLKEANKLKAKTVVIIGEDELKSRKATLKYMDESREEKVDFSDLVAGLRKHFGLN